MFLNIEQFKKLTKGLKNKDLCIKLNISRTQLWRALQGEKVGEKFISNFKKAFLNSSIDIFFNLNGA